MVSQLLQHVGVSSEEVGPGLGQSLLEVVGGHERRGSAHTRLGDHAHFDVWRHLLEVSGQLGDDVVDDGLAGFGGEEVRVGEDYVGGLTGTF